MGDSYSALGKFYDRLIEYPYDEMLNLVIQFCKGGKALDLFCGTGIFTRKLAQKGFNVQGSDLSFEMLQEAIINTRKVGLNLVYIQENALKFNSRGLDLITATSDGLNYIKPKDLPTFFKRVYDALNQGGYFIFDLSSYYKLTEILANNFFYEDLDDLTMFWQNSLSKDKVKMELTFFEKKGDYYKRSDETQEQYAHKKEDLEEIICQNSFKIVKILDEKFTKPKAKSERLFFVLEKCGG